MSNVPSSNRPYGRLDSQGRLDINFYSDESFRAQYSGDNLIYKGFAKPGADEGALVWQIAFFTYDGSGNILSIKWPQKLLDLQNTGSPTSSGTPSNDYEFSWTNRASYNYL